MPECTSTADMFQQVEKPSRGIAVLVVLAQMTLVYPVAALLSWPLLTLYSRLLLRFGVHDLNNPLHAFDVLIFAILGAALGLLMSRLGSYIRRTGQWAGVVPFLVFLLGFIHDAVWSCDYCGDAKINYFVSGGTEGLRTALITWPAICLAAYSIIMAWTARQDRTLALPKGRP